MITPIPYNGGTIWVDKKGEIKQGDTVYRFYQDGDSHIGESLPASDNLKRLKDDRVWKVIAQSINLSIPNIPYVEIEEDESVAIRDEADAYCNQFDTSENEELLNYYHVHDAFLEGYKAASAKKLSEEDLRKAFEAGRQCEIFNKSLNEDDYIQSLQPKVVSIEIEMENKTNEDIQIELGIYGHDEGLTEKEYEDYKYKNSILKPITYSKDGKTFLKVKSIRYES